MTALATRDGDYGRVRAAVTRVEMSVAIPIALVVLGSNAYIVFLFAPIAPEARLWPWSAYMAAVAAFMGLAPLALILRRAADAEILRLWAPLGRAFALLLDVGVAASVWLLLPYASEGLRIVMVVLYSALITGQLATQADSPATTAFGVIAIFGSAALFFLLAPGPYSGSLAVFLVVFGVLLVAMAVVLKNALRTAMGSRLRAERASSDLAAAMADLSTAQSAKSGFVAAATHDLRQPLQAAALFLGQAAEARQPDRRAAAVEGCRLALAETNAILEQLLDHLRLEAGALAPQISPTEANELMGRVADELRPVAAVEGIALRVAPTALAVLADAEQAKRALRNFVVNALRHARCRKVLLAARRRAERVRLYVIDDGDGVAAEDRGRLFHDYTQGARVSERSLGGMGLGLSSARRLAELMGGCADLDPAWRGGAAFYLELPRALVSRSAFPI